MCQVSSYSDQWFLYYHANIPMYTHKAQQSDHTIRAAVLSRCVDNRNTVLPKMLYSKL